VMVTAQISSTFQLLTVNRPLWEELCFFKKNDGPSVWLRHIASWSYRTIMQVNGAGMAWLVMQSSLSPQRYCASIGQSARR
jgi:hypothetical protein